MNSLISVVGALSGSVWLPLEACLFRDEVAVFRHRAISSIAAIARCWYDLLQPEEQDRAHRFRREADRLRFCYGRIMLKVLVAKYTDRNPAGIQLTEGLNKKPELKDIADLHINIAHAGEWVLLAISKKSVGVDVERISPDFPFETILAQSFSEFEQQYIRQSIKPYHCFYQLWTRKEALVKATAKGMDDDFSLIPSIEGEHYVEAALIGSSMDWYVGNFAVADDHLGAIAYQKNSGVPKFYTLESGFFN